MENRDLGTLLLFVIIMLCALIASAQTSGETENVIYFNNGQILRGEIVERDEKAGTLLLRTVGRNVVRINMAEVDSMAVEEIPTPTHYKEPGYLNETGFSIMPGSSGTAVSFRMVNGYQFTSRLSMGLGLGFTSYGDPLDLIPVFFRIKHKFLEANTTPFFSLSSGFSFSVHDEGSDDDPNRNEIPIEDHDGGFMLAAAAGIHFATGGNVAWYLQAGYNMDNAQYEEQEFGGARLVTDLSYRRILFSVGLSF